MLWSLLPKLLFLLTRIRTHFGPRKTNLLGARCGINCSEDTHFGLLYQASAGILCRPGGPQSSPVVASCSWMHPDTEYRRCVHHLQKCIVSTHRARLIARNARNRPAKSPSTGYTYEICMCRIAQPPRFPTPSTHDEGPKTELTTTTSRPKTRRRSLSPLRSRLELCALRSDRPKPPRISRRRCV